jgi:hypothetical protein
MNSPSKTASGKDCKKCIKKGSTCAQHGGSKNSSPKKDWEQSKFTREITEKLESLALKGSPKKTKSGGLRSPRKDKKIEATDEYEEDILEFLKAKEKSVRISTGFPKQSEITEAMRTILLDWISEVCEEYHLTNISFHLAISIIDRYMAIKHDIPRKNLQLIGITSVLIASKYEEMFPPSIDDFVYISDNSYTQKLIRDTEVQILQALKYEITYPTCANFADIYFDILDLTIEQKNMANYVMRSSALYISGNMYLPSLVAAGSIFYAIRSIPGKTKGVWSAKMRALTGYSEEEVREVAIRAALEWLKPAKVQAINLLYSRAKNSKVSTLPVVSETVLRETFSPSLLSPKKVSPKASPKKISPKKVSPKASPKKISPKKVSPEKINIKDIKVISEPKDVALIQYSDRYPAEDGFEYRHVILPPEIFRLAPKGRLLTEEQWRALGVQQSRGWVHYAIHRPEPNILLFKKPL